MGKSSNSMVIFHIFKPKKHCNVNGIASGIFRATWQHHIRKIIRAPWLFHYTNQQTWKLHHENMSRHVLFDTKLCFWPARLLANTHIHFHSHGDTPSSHPCWWRIFHEIKHSAIGLPPFMASPWLHHGFTWPLVNSFFFRSPNPWISPAAAVTKNTKSFASKRGPEASGWVLKTPSSLATARHGQKGPGFMLDFTHWKGGCICHWNDQCPIPISQ